MNEFFSIDGKLIATLNKIGQLILLNAIWLICCIPIITIGSATTSFYYATIKSVRRGRSYPAREFFKSFRRTLKQGIILTVALISLAAILYIDRGYMSLSDNKIGLVNVVIYDIIIALVVGMLMYLFPALSRFSIRLPKLLKMTFVMAYKHLLRTVLLILGLAASIILCLILPMPIILVLPGTWCYLSTYILEPILKKYTPAPEEGEDAWYYE